MTITIELTAEQLFEAAQQLPADEQTRLRELFNRSEESPADEEAAWHRASQQSATRFFEDEDAS